MLETTVYKFGVLFSILQFVIILALLYITYTTFRVDKRKRMLFLAFLMYGTFVLFHAQFYAVRAGLMTLSRFRLEAFAVVDHSFKFFFFLFYSYVIFDALATDKTIRKMNKINVYLVSLGIITFSFSMIIIEGTTLVFRGTIKELVYAVATLIVQLFIINMIYSSWMEVRSTHLMLNGVAFTAFFIAEATHTYFMIYGLSNLEFFLRHALRIPALALLAYILIHYKTNRISKVTNPLHNASLSGS